jgi:SmpA / OmlA family
MRHLFLFFVLLFLVAGCRQSSNEPPAEKANLDRATWRKLAKGMTQDQVRAVMGEPTKVETEGDATCWHYQAGPPLERNSVDPNQWVVGRGALLFIAKGGDSPKLIEWREP